MRAQPAPIDFNPGHAVNPGPSSVNRRRQDREHDAAFAADAPSPIRFDAAPAANQEDWRDLSSEGMREAYRAAKALRKQIDVRIQATKKKRTAKGTKKNYLRVQRIFCEKFMPKYFPEVPMANSVDSFLDNPTMAKILTVKENLEGENIVLLFLQTFHEFCVKDEKNLGSSTYGNARAAIRDLFKQAGALWDARGKFEEEIKDWCKGKTRTIAEYKLSGEIKATSGKRHMFFDLYLALAKQYFLNGHMFEWCFHVLTWNLMTRGVSTSNLRWSHLMTANDNVVFIIPKSKSDQEGRKLSPKHTYCNTLYPWICPIYALGLYTLCLSNQDPTAIFPGGQQLSRFAKALNRNKDNKAMLDLLTANGYTPDDIGVHSMRKGAGTFATNGILAMTPSISAICLRAGWTQGAIKDVYLQYEHAQDTYLGRVLCGMPVSGKNAHHFGDLPPAWGKNINDPVVKAALKLAFPVTQHEKFPASALGVFNRMLAVIVKNHYWISSLPEGERPGHNHPYWTEVFVQHTDFEELTNKLDNNPDLMRPTGIVGHIETIKGLKENADLLMEIIHVHLPKRDEALIGSIEKLLDDRDIHAPHATMGQLEDVLTKRLDPILQLVQGIAGGAPRPAAQVPPARRAGDVAGGTSGVRRKGLTGWNEWLHRDGVWYAIPQDCQYPRPKSGVLSLLSQYYFGRNKEGLNGGSVIMPIKKMVGTDLPPMRRKTLTQPACRAQHRLAEARGFCEFLEKNIESRWSDVEQRGYRIPPARVDIGKMFEHAHELIMECRPSWSTPVEKRRKTCAQKGWSTHYRDVSKWKRENGFRGQKLGSVLLPIPPMVDA